MGLGPPHGIKKTWEEREFLTPLSMISLSLTLLILDRLGVLWFRVIENIQILATICQLCGVCVWSVGVRLTADSMDCSPPKSLPIREILRQKTNEGCRARKFPNPE